MGRQRQLHQDAVEAVVPVELLHLLYHLALGAVLGQIESLGEDAYLSAGALLVADVDRRGGIVAHQDRRQARSVSVTALNSFTPSATSPRMSWAILLPSIISALKYSLLPIASPKS